MTHDELLEEINEAIADFDLKFDNSNPYYKALRAVVELHKPYESTDNGLLCRYEINSNSPYHWYPCETIHAIEKELG